MTAPARVRPISPSDKLRDLVRSLHQYASTVGKPGFEGAVRRVLQEGEGDAGDDAVASGKLNAVIRLFLEQGMGAFLSVHGLQYPRYRYQRDLHDDVAPLVWDPPRFILPPYTGWRLFGLPVRCPIGVPASELTSSADWIEYYARQGFNVLTYRTVRRRARPGRRDWAFVSGIDQPWKPSGIPATLRSEEGSLPPDWGAISTVTPFAAPSPDPDVWQPDVRDALGRLAEGQLLILSIMDSLEMEEKTEQALVDDFAGVARLAAETGVQAIECHLARATVDQRQPCEVSPAVAIPIVEAVRARIPDETKLLVKVSDLPRDKLEALVVPLVRSGTIQGVSGVSPVRVKVENPDGGPMFPDERLPGIAGLAIRNVGLGFVEKLARIRLELDLDFDIVGMGGVMNAQDVADYVRLGADAVQSATAARCDPSLALAARSLLESMVEEVISWMPSRQRHQVIRRLEESMTRDRAVKWLRASNAYLAGAPPVNALWGEQVGATLDAIDHYDAEVRPEN